ncbi:MAG TPA: ATP12 family protein [Spirochaetota bacterium]|nr:ATP12 family protein [Spirochaetota bacterium]
MAIASQSILVEEKQDGFLIKVDGTPLKTPAGATILLPTKRLAQAMVAELVTVDEIDPSRLGFYCLASTRLDFTDKGKSIPVEGIPKIILFDPALHALPGSALDVLESATEPVRSFLAGHGLVHPEIPNLPENEMEGWLADSPSETKHNIEGILRVCRDLFEKQGNAQHAVVINAGQVHRSFVLGLLLAEGQISTAEYAAAVMATLCIHPLAWNNIGVDQYRAAFEEVRLQADSMRVYLEEN